LVIWPSGAEEVGTFRREYLTIPGKSVSSREGSEKERHSECPAGYVLDMMCNWKVKSIIVEVFKKGLYIRETNAQAILLQKHKNKGHGLESNAQTTSPPDLCRHQTFAVVSEEK